MIVQGGPTIWLHIDPSSGVPIYLQITEQIKRAVAIGQLPPGEQLPTVKQLALDLVINPNTAAKAYRDLEKEGVIETFPGKGSFVSSNMVISAREEQLAKLTAGMRRLIQEADALGLRPREVVERFENAVADHYGREKDVLSHRDRESH